MAVWVWLYHLVYVTSYTACWIYVFGDDDCLEAFSAGGSSRGWLSASGPARCRSKAITQQNDTRADAHDADAHDTDNTDAHDDADTDNTDNVDADNTDTDDDDAHKADADAEETLVEK